MVSATYSRVSAKPAFTLWMSRASVGILALLISSRSRQPKLLEICGLRQKLPNAMPKSWKNTWRKFFYRNPPKFCGGSKLGGPRSTFLIGRFEGRVIYHSKAHDSKLRPVKKHLRPCASVTRELQIAKKVLHFGRFFNIKAAAGCESAWSRLSGFPCMALNSFAPSGSLYFTLKAEFIEIMCHSQHIQIRSKMSFCMHLHFDECSF